MESLKFEAANFRGLPEFYRFVGGGRNFRYKFYTCERNTLYNPNSLVHGGYSFVDEGYLPYEFHENVAARKFNDFTVKQKFNFYNERNIQTNTCLCFCSQYSFMKSSLNGYFVVILVKSIQKIN